MNIKCFKIFNWKDIGDFCHVFAHLSHVYFKLELYHVDLVRRYPCSWHVPSSFSITLYSHFTIPWIWLWYQCHKPLLKYGREFIKVYLLRDRCLYLALDIFLLYFTLCFVFWFSFAFGFIQLHGFPHVCGIDKTIPPNTVDSQQSPPSHEHSLVLYSAWQSPSSMYSYKDILIM